MYKLRDVESLWSKYENLLKNLNSNEVNKLVEDLGQRILTTSYSQKESEPFCGIGGLIEYSLELAKRANTLSSAMNFNISKASIIKCALLSAIGRIGNEKYDRFIEQDSDWHKEKIGQYYKWNEDCPKYKTQDMTLWYLQRYNISLTWEEWNAISLISDTDSDKNMFYSDNKSQLCLTFLMSHEVTIQTEKEKLAGTHVEPF